MTRLFVALDPTPDCQHDLAALAHEMRGARWLEAENIHLTLAFLGEVPDHQRQPLLEALESVHSPPFSIDLAGIGLFPRRGDPTTLWVGCAVTPRLQALKQRVDRALESAGLAVERRRFRPHVTLARLKRCRPDDLRSVVQLHSTFARSEVPIVSFSLYSSQLRPEGARYFQEQSFALRDEAE